MGCCFTRGDYQQIFLSFLLLALAVSTLSAAPIAIEVPTRDKPVDFEADVLPILRANCIACHSERKHEAGLILESPQQIAKGGESGPAVVAGKGGESLLLKVAAHQQESFMPPADNQVGAKVLTPAQLGLLKLWIDQGAGGTVSAARTIRWLPLPQGFQPIFATAVTPDGQYAACSRGNQIDVYHVPTGKLAARLIDPAVQSSHTDVIRSLAFDPKGELLASGGFREVKLWRRPRISVKAEWPQDAPLTVIALSPNGMLAAFGDETGKVRIVETASGMTKQAIAAHSAAVTGLAFSADGAVVYSASTDKTLKAWNAASGAAVGIPAQAATPIGALVSLKNGEWLVTGEEGGNLHVWDAKALRETAAGADLKPLKEIKTHGAAVTALVALSGPTNEVFSAGKDGLIRRWDAAGGNQFKEWRHDAPVFALAVSGDGKRLASAGENHVVRLWNLEKEGEPVQIQGDPRLAEKVVQAEAAVAFAKSALDLTKNDIKSYEGTERMVMVRAMDVKKAEEEKVKAEKMLEEKKQALEKAKAEKKDAKALEQAEAAVAEAMTAVQVAGTIIERAKVVSERAVADFAAAQKLAADYEATLKQQTDAKDAAVNAAKAPRPVKSLAFSSDNQRLLVGCEDGVICAYDAERGTPLEHLVSHKAAIRGLTPVGSENLLSISADKKVILWNAPTTWKLERTIGGLEHPELLSDRVLALDFSPDGQLLATGGGIASRSSEVKLWNVTSGQLVRSLPQPHEDTVFAVKFSPDGQHLASTSADRMVKVFSTASGELEKTFAGHSAHVLGVSWHSGGKLLVSCGTDRTLKLWDFEKGLPVRTMKGSTYQIGPYKGEVTSATFIGLSEQILACSGDGTVRLHRSSSENDILTFAGAKGYQYSVATSPDGQTLVAGGSDGVLRIWSGQNREPKWAIVRETFK
ncbi:MAG: c-type cytochrome domain-containing protein [Pirellulaceae bacterium]